MKRTFFISFGLVIALSLSLFCSCGDKNKVACEITLKNTASGAAAFENFPEKTMSFFQGDTVTVIATPKQDCEFVGWFEGKEKTPVSSDANYTFVASKSVTLLARFGKSPVVEVSSNGNGVAAFANSPEKSLVITSGNEVTVVATPDKNCEFIGWFADDAKVSTELNYTFAVSKKISLVAKFVKSPVVKINSEDYGKVSFDDYSGNSVIVLSGSRVAVTATPDKDCEFEGWFVGDAETPVSTELNYAFTASKNISLVAKFYPSPVVSISSEKNGKVAFANSSDDSLVVLKGAEATISATPDKNYEFVGWFAGDSKTAVSTDANYTFAVLEDISLKAKFKPSPIVTVSNSDNGKATIANSSDKSVIVFSGTEVTVTATPDEGFELYGWFVGNSDTPVSIELAYTFAANENVELFAEFRRTLNRHEYVDLGLPSGLKWATCNVGADVPENVGGYYAWGEVEVKNDYSWKTYKYYNNDYAMVTKYCVQGRFGIVDGEETLNAEDDAANANWGAIWRMPTSKELNELCRECSWKWTTINDVPGYEVTGPNGNSIFLPATGYKNDGNVFNKVAGGYYWTSTVFKSCNRAYYLQFDNVEYEKGDFARRYSGRCIRPVFK